MRSTSYRSSFQTPTNDAFWASPDATCGYSHQQISQFIDAYRIRTNSPILGGVQFTLTILVPKTMNYFCELHLHNFAIAPVLPNATRMWSHYIISILKFLKTIKFLIILRNFKTLAEITPTTEDLLYAYWLRTYPRMFPSVIFNVRSIGSTNPNECSYYATFHLI